MKIATPASCAGLAFLLAAAWLPEAQAQRSRWWDQYSGNPPPAPAAAAQASQAPVAPAAPVAGPQRSTPAPAPAPAPQGYTHVEAGYNRLDLSDDLGDEQGNGGYVRGSLAITDSLHLFGGYSTAGRDWRGGGIRLDVDVDQWEIGFGERLPISATVDLVGALSFVRLGADVRYREPGVDLDLEDALNAGKFTLGIVARPSPRASLWIKGGYIHLDDNLLLDNSWIGIAGGRLGLTPTWGLVGEAEFYKDVRYYRFGVRADF